MFLISQHHVMYWPEEDGCHKLHHSKNQYRQQNISLPCSIVWKTCYINLCQWLEEYNTESKILAFLKVTGSMENDPNVVNLIKGWPGATEVVWVIWEVCDLGRKAISILPGWKLSSTTEIGSSTLFLC